jgi:hypothetical protein
MSSTSTIIGHILPDPLNFLLTVQRVSLNKQKIEKLEGIDTFNLKINFETGFLEFRDFQNEIKFISINFLK